MVIIYTLIILNIFTLLFSSEKTPIRANLLVIKEDEKDRKNPFVFQNFRRRPHSQPAPLTNRSKGKQI